MQKTNAVRLLEKAGISFLLREYEVDEDDLSGEHVAETLGVEPERVFKTLVLEGGKGDYFICCIPSNEKIDLKKTAKAVGDKKATMIPVKSLLPLTGYVRGGCSPIGMKKAFPTFIDETAILFDSIIVSAGRRGAMLEVEPGTLASFVGASFVPLVME